MDDTLTIDIPDNCSVDIFKPKLSNKVLVFSDFQREFEKHQIASFLANEKVLIVVNDAHRSTPTAQILQWVKKLAPSLLSSATFLVACGTHKKPSEVEYIKIFGELYDELKDSIYYHDCHKAEELSLVGTDRFNEKFFLNKKVFEFEKVWFINSVEPHYFAGYTGGRKSLVPGLADFKTIERNHNLANSLACSPTKLDSNPMAEHLDSLLDMVDQEKFISLQIVTDKNKNICNLSFGTLQEAFSNAVLKAQEIYVPICESEFDLLILEILPPLDRSIYQAQKALENCQMAVKNDGTIIICSGCKDGVGSEHFYKLAENWDAEKNCPKDGVLTFGSHKLKRVNEISKRVHVYCKSTLSNDVLFKLFYKSIDNVSEYIDEISKNKENYKVGVVYDAAHIVLKKAV